MTTESFVLEAIDTLTQCIEVDVLLRVDNVEELCNTLEREAAGFNPKLMYDLDTSDVEKLMVRYGLKFDPGSCAVRIRPADRMDSLPYVAAGRFIKRVQHGIRIKGLGPEHRRVFYAQPGEEWRIDAYILMKKVAERSGWGEALERMEGSLLGYEDWQNDVFIKTLYRPKRWGLTA